MEDTSMGLKENVAGLLCYLLGWVSGFIFLIVEPKNRFIRFHAFQSIIVFGILTVIIVAVGWLTNNGYLFGFMFLLTFVLWVLLMLQAGRGLWYKLPWVGNLGETWL